MNRRSLLSLSTVTALGFGLVLFHTDLPKIDNRMGGTPDQHKAIAQGVVAYYV
jgi:hypothetical protein